MQAMKRPISLNVINQLNTPPETTPLQKVLIIFALGAFIALVSLTASLPLPYLSHQPTSLPSSGDDDTTSTIQLGDTAWVIVATFFALMLSPLLAYVYSNLYGRSSSFTVQASLIVGSVITVLWIIITFSLTFAKDANGDQILGFPKYYYMFAHVGNAPDGVYTVNIPFLIFAVFELSFPLLAATIVISSVIDRVNVYGLLFFLFVWHVCIYTPIAHITWNVNGFFYTNEIIDSSGGLVVHMTAGITALTMHLFLDWFQAPKAEPRRPNNPEDILFGILGVWLLWFGINAGKADGATSVACQSIVNTIAGVVVAVLVNYCLDHLEAYKFTNITLTNSILIGLISTSPSNIVVTVGGSMVVACFTTLVVRVIGKYIFKETLEDTPYSIPILHGVGGSTAFLFTALISYAFVNPSYAQNGLTWGVDITIRHHTAAVLAMWICLFCTVLLALLICNFIVPLSKASQSAMSPKGEYAPASLGPFGSNNDAYKEKANYNIDSNSNEVQEEGVENA